MADAEIAGLTAEQIGVVLDALCTPPSRPDGAAVRVQRSLEETKAGLALQGPKSRRGCRAVSLPTSVVEIVRGHQRRQAEQRQLLGLGRATLMILYSR